MLRCQTQFSVFSVQRRGTHDIPTEYKAEIAPYVDVDFGQIDSANDVMLCSKTQWLIECLSFRRRITKNCFHYNAILPW